MPQISQGKLKHLNALSNNNGVIAAAAMGRRGNRDGGSARHRTGRC